MSAQLARWLHPGAWWLWALGLAACASRLTNPLMLALVIAVLAFVVSARRPDAPWGRSFAFFVRLAVLVVVIRVLAQVVFGAAIGTTVLLPLPGITLPTWMAGVRLGGDVLLESLLVAFVDGLRLATILLCVGAANSLASPSRLLKSVPSALYEIGVSVVVAMSFTPQLVGDVQRVRQARRLRGRRTTGVRAIAGAAMPVLEGALERSVALAAAMDSRGYGRRGEQGPAARRAASTLLLAGLACASIGTYALLSAGIPAPVGGALVVVTPQRHVRGHRHHHPRTRRADPSVLTQRGQVVVEMLDDVEAGEQVHAGVGNRKVLGEGPHHRSPGGGGGGEGVGVQLGAEHRGGAEHRQRVAELAGASADVERTGADAQAATERVGHQVAPRHVPPVATGGGGHAGEVLGVRLVFDGHTLTLGGRCADAAAHRQHVRVQPARIEGAHRDIAAAGAPQTVRQHRWRVEAVVRSGGDAEHPGGEALLGGGDAGLPARRVRHLLDHEHSRRCQSIHRRGQQRIPGLAIEQVELVDDHHGLEGAVGQVTGGDHGERRCVPWPQ